MTMQEMQAALADLLAREQIEEVILRYAHGLDKHDADLLAACFAPEGSFTFHGTTYTGVENVVGCIRPFFESPFVNSTHFMGRPRIVRDGDTAHVETFSIVCLAEKPDGSGKVKLRGITYTDRFVKHGGKWLIESRVHDPRWMTEGTSVFPGNILEPDAATH